MNAQIIKDMDKLERNWITKFYYDIELDMEFETLDEWLQFKWNKTWSEIL